MSEAEEEIGVQLPDKLFFRIGEVAELVGVEPHVLRYWEGEFKLRPTRSPSGQRMYRRKDIGKFLKIKRLLHDEGFTIAGARKALADGGAPIGGSSPAPTGAAPSPTVGGGGVGRVGEAAERVQHVRQRIAELRARFANERGVAVHNSTEVP